jgi:hypothetical protein
VSRCNIQVLFPGWVGGKKKQKSIQTREFVGIANPDKRSTV